jgi:hypothetical protein
MEPLFAFAIKPAAYQREAKIEPEAHKPALAGLQGASLLESIMA